MLDCEDIQVRLAKIRYVEIASPIDEYLRLREQAVDQIVAPLVVREDRARGPYFLGSKRPLRIRLGIVCGAQLAGRGGRIHQQRDKHEAECTDRMDTGNPVGLRYLNCHLDQTGGYPPGPSSHRGRGEASERLSQRLRD